MAKRKNGFDTTMLEKYGEQLETLGGHAAIKRAVNSGMAATKQEVNKQVNAAMQPSNLPAGGTYSTGATLESLNKDLAVKWEGNLARLSLGFVLKNSGLTSIFLMYGTPRMRPVDGLYDVLKGSKARSISRKEQKAAILKIIKRLGG